MHIHIYMFLTLDKQVRDFQSNTKLCGKVENTLMAKLKIQNM